MPTSGPSFARLRHRLRPTGGWLYAWFIVTIGLSLKCESFIPFATTISFSRSISSVVIHDTSARSPSMTSVGALAVTSRHNR